MMGEGTLIANTDIDDQRILPIIRSVNAGKLSDIDIVRPDISDSAGLHALDFGMKKHTSGAVYNPLSQSAIVYGKEDFEDESGLTIAAMPAYNEENTIAKIILGCRKYVNKVIVIDDGSTDATVEIAEALGAHVVRHRTNQGYGTALRDCFKTARELGADRMVIIDSDGQHNPSEIPNLLEPLHDGFDLVIGSRFVNGNGKNIPVYRKVGMKVLDTATNIVGEINVSDSQSGFRSYGKKAIEKIRINDTDMSAGSEILMQIKDHDLMFKEVEIHCTYDVENASSQNPAIHGFKVLMKILGDMEFRRPLFYFTAPGMFSTGLGVLMGLIFLNEFFKGGNLLFGPTLLMILLMLVGMFMVFTGIILHSMSRLIKESTMNLG